MSSRVNAEKHEGLLSASIVHYYFYLQKLEELGITADVPIVSTRWLRDCFVRGKKVQEQPYLLRSD